MIYALCLVLIFVGVYGLATKRNVVKMVLGLAIADYGANLLLVLLGYRTGGRAPIADHAADVGALAAASVDPIPQALVLTSIVIGLGVLALQVALCVRLYDRFKTYDVTKMRRLKG